MNQTILAVSVFFHIVSAVVWIGGLLLTVILVWPEVSRTLKDNPVLHTVLTRLRQRFAPISNLALAVLVVTGLLQMAADPNYDGVMHFTNDWSRVILLKHLAIFAMVGCGAILQFGVSPALERLALLAEHGKDNPQEWAKLRRREVLLTWINAGLGVLVLGFSAWAVTL